ncbi:MAG: hypothetical protein JSV03_16680 [Planctomycetota bacterium]|nr:MAG: hypothetical protein JSV03_16680 [Planctomycetota bacterium]
MTDANDELRKKIFEDKPINNSQAEEFKASILRQYERKQKKLVVATLVQLLIMASIAFVGCYMLGRVDNIKLMLGALLVILIGFESTILIKLWYWIVASSNNVLQDVKRLQLLTLGQLPVDQTESSLASDTMSVAKKSLWDRINLKVLNLISMIILIGFSLAGTFIYVAPAFNVRSFGRFEEHIQIAADGSCTATIRTKYRYAGLTPLEAIKIRSSQPFGEVTWHDKEGNKLVHEVQQDKDCYLCTVHLNHPIFRDEQVDIRASNMSLGKLAKKENGVWVIDDKKLRLTGRQIPAALTINPQHMEMKRTVMLPPRAKCKWDSTIFKHAWMNYNGRHILSFDKVETMDFDKGMRITYHLPDSDEDQKEE